MEMIFTGYINAWNLEVTPPLTLNDIARAHERVLEIIVSQQLGINERLLDVIVTRIGGIPITSRRNLRNHLEARSLADVLTKIEFEIRVETLCGTGNCQDGLALTDALYKEVTDAIDDAINKGDANVAGSFGQIFLSVTTENGQNLLISVDSYKEGTYGG